MTTLRRNLRYDDATVIRFAGLGYPRRVIRTSAGDDTLRAMSLFVRLWIVATLTAFASAAAGVVILMVISTQGRVDQENWAALTLSRMVAFTVSMAPLEKLRGKAAADLLLRRAQGLMAMGPLLFVTVVEAKSEEHTVEL